MNASAGCFCPRCKIENYPGAVTCAFCNHPLNPASPIETKPDPFSEAQIASSPSRSSAQQSLLLFVPGFERPIPIEGDQSVILGRNLEKNLGPQGEVIFDLSPFEALDSGVSRRHALVRPVEDGFEICDMGSTNGTWLNQTRILPGRPYRLDESSEIRLGRMVVHLVVRISRRQTCSLAA
jgi:pSer/pThr/pTyr-binding forkhead associated (FHA) protein